MKNQLILWLLLSVTIPSFAYDFQSGDLYYDITSDSTVKVTWDSNGANRKLTSVVIPESVTYNGNTYSVTIIGRAAFKRCTGLTSITIPNSVTDIGEDAFEDCTSLTSVIIPNSVTTIGNGAFGGCTGLTFVTISNSVTTIEYKTFYKCTGLTSVTIPDGVTDIGDNAFEDCTNLTSITIPNSVTIIGNNAFIGTLWYENQPDGILYIGSILYKYKGVPPGTTIIVKNGTTSISSGAFSGCTGLIYVSIPNSVTTIGKYAFSDVANIVYSGTATGSPWGAKSVNGYIEDYFVYSDATKKTLLACSSTATGAITFPNSVTDIGAMAFSGCTGLTSITIPNSVTTIGNGAFLRCTGLTSVTIPDGVTSIGDWGTFYYCTGLTSVTIGNSVTTIGSEAFYNCNNLTSVTIGNGVTSIGHRAFYNCDNLTSVAIGNSVTTIGSEAFSGEGSFNGRTLTSITIPNSVITIGSRAFSGRTGLTSITIPNSVTDIGEDAFRNVFNIIYYGTATGAPWGAENMNGYEEGYLFYSDITKRTLLRCNRTATETITIPNSVTTIGVGAFWGCIGLTSVTIPNSVTTIGEYAFYGCDNLTSVTIPNSVTTIGEYAFGYCYELTSVTIPNSVTTIGEYAFGYCIDLISIAIPNSVTTIGNGAFHNVFNIAYSGTATGAPWGAKNMNGYEEGYLLFSDATKKTLLRCNRAAKGEIIIPSSVTSIEGAAFECCTNLTSVTIPNSVTSIGYNAFHHVANIVYSGTATGSPWGALSANGYIEGYFVYSDATKNTLLRCNRAAKGEIIIPSSVTSIGTEAFWDCTELTSVTIPNSVTTIGNYAFYDCSKLTSVTIPNSVTTIGEYAFYNVFNIVYSGTATSAPWGAKNMNGYEEGYLLFSDATKKALLRCNRAAKGEIIIPNSVTSIEGATFSNCTGLTSVTCYIVEPLSIYENTFSKVNVESIPLYVPQESVTKYQETNIWRDFMEIKAISATPVKETEEPVLEPEENKVTVTWPTTDDATTYTLEISKDGTLICTLTFDANGVLQSMRFAAPSRSVAQHTAQAQATGNGFRFVVEGLDRATTYAYSITATDKDETVLSNYSGTFTTQAPTGTEDILLTPSQPTPRKVFRNGQVYILRNDKMYNINGTEM